MQGRRNATLLDPLGRLLGGKDEQRTSTEEQETNDVLWNRELPKLGHCVLAHTICHGWKAVDWHVVSTPARKRYRDGGGHRIDTETLAHGNGQWGKDHDGAHLRASEAGERGAKRGKDEDDQEGWDARTQRTCNGVANESAQPGVGKAVCHRDDTGSHGCRLQSGGQPDDAAPRG